MNRRKFIKKSALATLGLGFATGIYSWQIEPFWLEFVRKTMPIQNLPEKLIGKKLMQISDIHIGDRFDYQYIIDSFKKAKEFQPDFVVYTGDFVNYETEKQFAQLNEVLPHFVKGKLGTFGVLGNHDYGKNWSENLVAEQIIAQLNSIGIQMLRNEQINSNGMNFIGIDDFWGTNFNAEKAMKNYESDSPTIVLCHNPDVCDLDVYICGKFGSMFVRKLPFFNWKKN